MTEEGQRTFGDFQDDGDEQRPTAEAEAVAGNGSGEASVVDIDERQFPPVEDTVEFVVTQVDYTVEGRGDDEYPVVHVFGRTAAHEAVHVRVFDFKPYFYAPTDSVSEDRLRGYDRITGWEEADSDGDPYESIRGERLTKIFGQTPRDVGQMRDDFDHYEADILFPNRLLIDTDITSGVRVPARELDDGSYKVHHEELRPVEVSAPPRVNTFDIEVDDRHGFPEDGEQTIVCLTSHDSYDDEYIVWLYESPDGIDGPEALAGYDPIREDADFDADVRIFEEETAMLDAFITYIEETNPDVLTGWNCLPADSDILMADGTVKPIEDVEIGESVVGSDDEETTVTTVTNKWESEKEILRFELADGSDVRSSPDHRIMVGDDDGVDWKDASEIEPGEYVLKPRRLNVDDPTVPTLRSLIPIEKQRYANDDAVRQFKSDLPHGAVSKLAENFEPTKETLYHPTTSVWTPKRCRQAAARFGLPVPDGGRVFRRTDVGIDRELTQSELYLAGLVLTDGSMSAEDGIRFYNTREELHDQFPGDASLTPDGKGCYKQNVLDYARLHAFNGLGIPFGDTNAVDVDLSTIYEMPETFIAQFLAGVIDGDGNISDSVTVAAENDTIGDWYVKLFKRLGIYATRRDNVVRVPNAERDIERLKRHVLPNMSHSAKVDQLRTLEGGRSGQSENIPFGLFEAEIGTDAKRIGRDKHRRGINLKRHETPIDDWEEYVFVEVTDRTTDGTETTYDIETATHNFIAEDCLVHNCDDFDIPYYLDRLEQLQSYDHDYDLNVDRLSRVDEVWRSDWQGPDIKGRVVFDLLYAYKRTQFTELESYRLDAVGEQELGVGKERYTGDIGDLWEQDPERLLEYNLRDVELCVELDREQDIIDFWDEVRTFVGCKLEDATTPGDAVDMYVLHKLHGEYALPSKGQQESEDYEGGAVFDPITGVRENVTVLDLKCFSGDTEVMTPEGPKNIKNVGRGDGVYTLNPDTFECEIKPVTETHQYENTFGELHHLSGNTHDFKITENHRLLYSKERGWDEQEPSDFEFAEFRDIPEYERFAFPHHGSMTGRSPETFDLLEDVDGGNVVVYSDDDLRVFRNAVPSAVRDSLELVHGSSAAMGIQKSVGKYLIPLSVYHEHRAVIDEHADDVFLKYGPQHRETPLEFEMTDWLEFLGWFVTEGSVDRANGRVTLHQNDDSGRAAMQDLLDRMGINYNVDERGLNISNQYLLDWLADNCGQGYENKQFPEWVFDLDGELLSVLLNTMIRGDGSRTESGLGKFWTKSPHLRDAAADIAVRCGHKPTVSEQSDGTYSVSIGKRGSFKKETNADVETHDGDVYCITAQDNHVVLAGRNGNFQWIGQSLYPMCMVTTNASPETKVDPEQYDGATYRAPNGTHFRKEPDGIIREMVDELLTEREEKKERRNSYDPDNPEYERLDRQQAAVKVIMNCFTPDTDVLTPDGVRNIRDLTVGDEVYSLDPETEEMEVKPVVETHEYPDYRGDLVDIETSKMDFQVTPNHRMLVRKNDKNGITEDGWKFKEAGELYDYCHYEMPHDWDFRHTDRFGETIDIVELAREHIDAEITVSDGGTTAAAKYGTPNISRTVPTDDFLEFLAWYITEGSVYAAKTANYRVKIAQEEHSQREEIETLVEQFVDYCYTDDRSVSFSSRVWAELLTELCGSGSANKQIPELVFEASGSQKRAFLETLIKGDGDWQKNAWRFSTTSQQLRDDVMRLCTHLGLTANYTQEGTTWRIYCTEDSKNSFRMYRDGSESTAADGVYCVTVKDNNTLLAGRNGTFQNVGNSLYGVLGWDRFRLYDKEMGAAVTATGREVIDYTDEVVENEGYEVVYGDSVTGDRPVVVRDPDGLVRIKPIAKLFQRAEQPPEERTVVASDGGRAAVAASNKDRLPLPGWDALSVNDDGETEWRAITQVIRHETKKDVVTLQHKFGESTTTRDHSYVVEEEGTLVERPPDGVDEPLRVDGLPDVDTVETVDVYEVLNGYTRTYEDGRMVGAENAVEKTKRVHADDEWVWFGHSHHDGIDKYPKIQRHIDLEGEDGRALVRLLAAYVTEGSASTTETTNSRYGASICESRREWLEGLQADYHRLFEDTTASIVASDARDERTVEYETAEGPSAASYDDGTKKLQMMNELAAVFFREFAGQKSRGKRIPSFVFHLPEDLQSLFLDVLVEGDGSWEFPRYSEAYSERNFDFETTSRELAAGLSMLLTQRGRKHSLKYRDEMDSYTIRTCECYRSGRDPVVTEMDHDGYVYDLSVEENENFVDAVGGIVLHNTDSVMLQLGDIGRDDVEADVDVTDAMREKHPEMDDDELELIAATIAKGFELEETINDSYDEFALEELNAQFHRFEIEFEKLYRRFFQAGKKKRYAGHIVWKEGKDVDDIDITGFEYQRSDIAPITKRVQKEVIDRIVKGEDAENIKGYVGEVIEDYQAGNVDYDDVGIPGGIGKKLDNYDTDTAQVRGAKYANLLLGTNFQSGSKPKRLYLDRVHADFFERIEDEQGLDPATDPLYGEFRRDPDVICFEYADQIPEEFEIDWDKMLDKTLKGPIARILEALDISWEEVKSGQEQTGLGQYM